MFPIIEKTLRQWIKELNSKDLRVKEIFIRMKELDIAEKLRKSRIENADKLEAFQASVGWIVRFKNQHNLVSRYITSQRTLLNMLRRKQMSTFSR